MFSTGLLNRVSELVDAGKVISTARKDAGSMNVESLRGALKHQASGAAIGKTVLGGMD